MTSSWSDTQVAAPEIELKQVCLETSLQAVADGLSFSVARSAKVGIVGASGAGKTTLLRLLNRLITPVGGKVSWRGKPLAHYSAPLLRQNIMLVPQEPRLLGMSVDQTLAYGLQIQRLPAEQIEQRVQLWRKRLSVPEDWGPRQEVELSVGQRQWVSIARALIAQPQVLLLDEPTSALDAGRTEQLIQTIRQLDSTVFVASHQVSLIQETCERVLWIERGAIRQDCRLKEMNWQQLKDVLVQQNATSEWDDLA